MTRIFAIFVSPLEDVDEYNLVIYADGMVPEYKKIITLLAEETLTFPDDAIQLGVASTKYVEGFVTITGRDTEQFASLSFRQDIGSGEMIEITSVDVSNTEGYNIDLPVPVEQYTVVAWTPGFNTQTSTLTKLDFDTPPVEKDIKFPES